MSLQFNNPEYDKILNNLNSTNYEQCIICKESIIVDKLTLKCNHIYHSKCFLKSFPNYGLQTCLICYENINSENFKSSCCAIKRTGMICNLSSFNDDKLCTIHCNSKLKTFLKNNNKEKNMLIKNINKEEIKLLKMNEKINLIENTIKEYKEKLNKLKI